MFLTEFSAHGDAGLVAFCPRFPGTIVTKQLQDGEALICRKETFLCAENSVHLDVFFRQQLGGGFFGGEGFILQKVTGPGRVFLDLSGEVVQKNLQYGETLRVHVGHVGVQDSSVEFGITMLKGFKNIMFGGDGIFVATLRGPGTVYLQSMPIANLAEEIFKYGMPTAREGANDTAGGVIGGLLDGLLRGGDDR